ncbi:hypothetical protein [Butyricicoccus sp.]|uniref:hypothetical protein n=1 Tax=Butyricicoccus sp. TaxID=2049021 RepID=UPI003F14FE98
MSINELVAGGGGAVLVLLTLIQIAPIEVNPWSAIAAAVGRAINGEVISKVDQLGNELQSLRSISDEREAKAARIRILRFGDEIYQGTLHSKEHFDQTLDDITEYEQYCDTHQEFKNDMTTITVQTIKETYQKCLEKHNFL